MYIGWNRKTPVLSPEKVEKKFRKDKKAALKAIKKDSKVYHYASERIKKDSDIIFAVIKCSHFFTKNYYVSSRIKLDDIEFENEMNKRIGLPNVMEENHTAYLFSDTEKLAQNDYGLFKVMMAPYTFNHFNLSHRYLHKVGFNTNNISRYVEKGHHDGASDFSFDEYAYITHARPIMHWNLTDKDSLFELLSSDFMKKMRTALVTCETGFNDAIIKITDDDLAFQFIQYSDISTDKLMNSLRVKSPELIIKLVQENVVEMKDIINASN